MPCNKSKVKRLKISLIFLIGVLFLDQILKNLFLKINLFQRNYHSLFGLNINKTLALSALFIFFIFIFVYKQKNKFRNIFIPAGLIICGITSNFIDKIRWGFIIDYINFANIFTFNLADLCILIGASLFAWHIIKE